LSKHNLVFVAVFYELLSVVAAADLNVVCFIQQSGVVLACRNIGYTLEFVLGGSVTVGENVEFTHGGVVLGGGTVVNHQFLGLTLLSEVGITALPLVVESKRKHFAARPKHQSVSVAHLQGHNFIFRQFH